MVKLNKIKGVTLIEILVVVALLGITFLGIYRLFRYAFDSWWLGSSRLSLQQDAREAMYWIANDMKKAKRSSIGNLGTNTDFETPTMSTGPFTGWTVPFPAGVYNVSSQNPQEIVRSGYHAAKLTSAVIVNYNSDTATPFVFPYTGNYIVSGWIFNSNTAAPVGNAEIRLMQPGGIDLVPAVSLSAATTGYWRYLTATFAQNQSTNFIVTLRNLQAGTTVYFDDIGVSPSVFTFNTATPADRFFGYGRIGEFPAGSENYRLHFSTGTTAIPLRNILREQKVSGTWVPLTPLPLCKNVESVTITNYNQDYFEVILTLFDPNAKGVAGQQRYSLKTQIRPEVP